MELRFLLRRFLLLPLFFLSDFEYKYLLFLKIQVTRNPEKGIIAECSQCFRCFLKFYKTDFDSSSHMHAQLTFSCFQKAANPTLHYTQALMHLTKPAY